MLRPAGNDRPETRSCRSTSAVGRTRVTTEAAIDTSLGRRLPYDGEAPMSRSSLPRRLSGCAGPRVVAKRPMRGGQT